MTFPSAQAPGLLNGSAGQAIAQTLQGLAQRNIPQPTQDPMSKLDLPQMMEMVNKQRLTDASLQDTQLKQQRTQQALDMMRRLSEAQGQGGTPQPGQSADNNYGQLGLAMALMGDTGNAAGSFSKQFQQQEDDKNKMVLATLQHDILNANIDPTNPEAGMVALLRDHSPEDLKAIAEATGNNPKVLQETLDSMTNLVVSGKMNLVRPVIDHVVDQLDEMYNNPGSNVLATHDKTADKTLSAVIGAASQKFITDNPNSGMTAEQVSRLVHQSLPQGLASLKAIVDIHNVGTSVWATQAGVAQQQQQIGIAQQNANTAQFNAQTSRYSADQGLNYEQQATLAQARAAAIKPQVVELGSTVIEGLGEARNGIPVGQRKTVTIRGVLDPTTGQYNVIQDAGPGGSPAGDALSPQEQELQKRGYKKVNGKWQK